MKDGHYIGMDSNVIDNKVLRRFNAEAFSIAGIEYLKTKCNILETARIFSSTRTVIWDILKRGGRVEFQDSDYDQELAAFVIN